MFGVPIHVLIIHFPIALTIVAVIYDSWGVYSNESRMHEVSYGLTLWAAVSALAAVVTGLEQAGNIRIPRAVVTGHAGFGIASAIVITALGVLRYSARARDQKGYRLVWLILGWGATVLVAAAMITAEKMGS